MGLVMTMKLLTFLVVGFCLGQVVTLTIIGRAKPR